MEISPPAAADSTTLRPTGELDLDSAGALRSAGEAALAASPRRQLVLDTAGPGALVSRRNAALASGASLALRDPTLPVRRVLQLTAMDTVFDHQQS